MPDEKRLFFGIRPDDAVRRELERFQVQAAVPGRKVPPENFHLTLAFLGNCDAEREACCDRAASGVLVEPFRLRLNSCSCFERARTAYIAPQVMPQELRGLHKRLARALRRCDYRPPHTFRPHLTMFRGLDGFVVLDVPTVALEWDVESFSLIESRLKPNGARYRILADYPLP